MQGGTDGGHILEQAVGVTLGFQVNIQNSHLRGFHQACFSIECDGQQLVAQTKPEIGHLTFQHGRTDGFFFRDEPRVFLFLPYIHRAAHDYHGVVSIE